MKAFFFTMLLFGLLGAALFLPVSGRSFCARAQEHRIPAAVARGTAHGLRATWDFLTSLDRRADPAQREQPAQSPRHPPRKAQAAAPQPVHRASREGIVAQPPKEKIEARDRVALDALVAHAR
jgi:hypothetical protein